MYSGVYLSTLYLRIVGVGWGECEKSGRGATFNTKSQSQFVNDLERSFALSESSVIYKSVMYSNAWNF